MDIMEIKKTFMTNFIPKNRWGHSYVMVTFRQHLNDSDVNIWYKQCASHSFMSKSVFYASVMMSYTNNLLCSLTLYCVTDWYMAVDWDARCINSGLITYHVSFEEGWVLFTGHLRLIYGQVKWSMVEYNPRDLYKKSLCVVWWPRI